jgi:hypothetical protein
LQPKRAPADIWTQKGGRSNELPPFCVLLTRKSNIALTDFAAPPERFALVRRFCAVRSDAD